MSVKGEFLELVSFIVMVAICRGYDDDYYDDDLVWNQITVKPQILSQALTINASIGSSVTLPCRVENLVDHVMIWKAGTNKVLFALPLKITRDNRFQITDETSLHFNDIQPTDSGNYICVISTSPPTELVHTLNVFSSAKPETKTPVQHLKAKEGTATQLTCVVEGWPQPTVTWKKGEKTLSSNQYYELKKVGEHNHILRIHNVSETDFGQYECSAVNSLGTSSTIINVKDETPEDTTVLADNAVSRYGTALADNDIPSNGSLLRLMVDILFLCVFMLIIPYLFRGILSDG